jgi:hypothetical protein
MKYQDYEKPTMGNLSHLKPGKAGDSAGVQDGLSDLKKLDVMSQNPMESGDGSAKPDWFSTQRITENPRKEKASKNGKSFDIC